MTALALGAKWGLRGASGSRRSGAAAPSRARSDPNAIAPTPTPQSRKKCRRVRVRMRALSSSCRVMVNPLFPRDELVEVHQHPRHGIPGGLGIGPALRLDVGKQAVAF